MTDQLIRATAADGGIRAVAVISTDLTEEARRRHKMSSLTTVALGQVMTASLLLASNMKQPQSRLSMGISGDGELGLVFADAGLDGTVRGYVSDPTLELPLNAKGNFDISGAIGRNGFLQITKDVGYGTPSSGTVELVSGEISENVTYYLVSSEQTPSALLSGVFIDSHGVAIAGGLLLQLMPKAARDNQLIGLLESRVANLSGFTPLLREGKSLTEIFEDLLGDINLEIFPNPQPVKFQCRCSFERVLGALRMFGATELRDMIEQDHGAEAICQFCSNVYQANPQDLEEIISQLQEDTQLV